MKLYITSAIATAILLGLQSPTPILSSDSQKDTDTINGIEITKYDISQVLDKMIPPTDTVPPHLQYIVGLDQSGAVVPSTGISTFDPEYSVTLSSGRFEEKKEWWNKKKVIQQTIDRCQGGGWVMMDVDSTEWDKDGTSLSNTGRGFMESISQKRDNCYLYFKWNEQMTEAKIEGYFNSLVGGFFGSGFDKTPIIKVAIELLPYWQWKFGVSDLSTEEEGRMQELDAKCCPSKNDVCKGKGTLGKKGSKCETISMACGDINESDLEQCAMYKRRNYLLFGLENVPSPDLKLKEYLVYPLADKHGPTPYNKYYMEALKKKGVETLFHGV